MSQEKLQFVYAVFYWDQGDEGTQLNGELYVRWQKVTEHQLHFGLNFD